MIQLNFYEQFVVTLAISFLSVLRTQTANAAAHAAIDSANVFLQELLAGQVPTGPDAVPAPLPSAPAAPVPPGVVVGTGSASSVPGVVIGTTTIG
jgi:hypothetical protein